jgi:hypothetical protein
MRLQKLFSYIPTGASMNERYFGFLTSIRRVQAKPVEPDRRNKLAALWERLSEEEKEMQHRSATEKQA